MQRIIKSLGLLVGSVAVITAGATGAFFSDTETSADNTFTAGAVDLLVANDSYYNGVHNEATSWGLENLGLTHKFFDFLDLKPGDWGEDTIALSVEDNDSYICAEVTLTSNDDNEPTEPETLVDNDTGVGLGELAGLVNFIWWADDGDNVLESDETPIHGPAPIGGLTLNQPFSIVIADSDENIWGGAGPVIGATSNHIGKAWCFGTMMLTPVPEGLGDNPSVDPGFDCDGSGLGNESQTDTLTADITFTAVQARNNPNYQCEETPVFTACTEGQQYADDSAEFAQGTQKSGAAVLGNRSIASAAFGAPQTSGAASDAGFPVGSFVSLGFDLIGGTPHGSLVLDFSDNVVVDLPGNDLKVYEITGGSYPDETIQVEVSQDGVTFFPVAGTYVRDAEIDIDSSGLGWARYVKVIDVSDIGLFPNDADAYDLDAIEALHCGALAV